MNPKDYQIQIESSQMFLIERVTVKVPRFPSANADMISNGRASSRYEQECEVYNEALAKAKDSRVAFRPEDFDEIVQMIGYPPLKDNFNFLEKHDGELFDIPEGWVPETFIDCREESHFQCIKCKYARLTPASAVPVTPVSEKQVELTCIVCGTAFMGDEPRMCCSGRECGCMGLPIDPIVCSKECYDKGLQKPTAPVTPLTANVQLNPTTPIGSTTAFIVGAPVREGKERYYKLVIRKGGGSKDIAFEWFDDLDSMVRDTYHMGINGYPCVVGANEVSKDEYEKNYLPI